MILDLFIYIIQFYINQNTFLPGFIIRKRITLRGATYHYYNVKEYGNGCIILEPRELSVPKSISARTLADMDHAVSNFKCGDVSTTIGLSDL